MGGQNNWRVNISGADWMRDIEKRILYEERRPNIRSASDLMGPGFGPYAVETGDWSADETAFNGMFFSAPGAQNSPNPANYWIGTTEGTADGNGFELVRAFDPNTGVVSPDSYIRYFYTPPGTGQRRYTDWEVSAGGGGTGGPPSGPAGGDLAGTYPNPVLSPATKALMMVDVADEGSVVSTDVSQINFVGGGVVASSGGAGVATITIAGSSGGPPTGPAGGDLSGTYPNPTVAPNAINSSKIQDGSITSADLAPGTIPSSLPPSGTAGGSLTGTYPNPGLAANSVGPVQIVDGSITDADVNALNKDGAAGTPSMRTLGTGAQQAAAGNDSRIVNAASVSYVDAQNQLDPSKRSVRLATTAAVGTAGLQTIDGFTLVDGDRVLVKNNATSNTIYVAHATAWTVATDIDTTAEAESAFVTVRQGTTNNGTTWRVGNGSVTDLDALFWVPYIPTPSGLPPSGAAGGDLAGTYPNPTIGTGKVTSAAIADGTIQSADIAAGVIPTTLPGPPTGAAGGSLSGTYPNPAIATNAIGSNQIVDGSIQAGDLAAGVIPSSLPPSGAAGGDLGGTYPNPTVVQAQNGFTVQGAGTANIKSVVSVGTNGLGEALNGKVTGDAQGRIVITDGGVLKFGDGTSAPDANLYRTGPDALQTDDALRVQGAFVANTTAGVTGLLTAFSGASMNNQKITSVATPTTGTDGANKNYVDGVASGNGGAGLTNAGTTLNVGAGAGIQVNADTVQVADNGITNAMIADGAINLGSADVTGTLPITAGGTGATTAAAARAALGTMSRFASTVSLTAMTEQNVAHALNTSDVTVTTRTSGNVSIELNWRVIDANTIGVSADVALSNVRVVVVG